MSHGCWRLIHPCDNITSLAADTFTSLWEMKAVFEDMLCPLFKCPLAPSRFSASGAEKETRLRGHAMEKESAFPNHKSPGSFQVETCR